ncbi:hypothetical protein BV25DRAFT_1825812 [Artomyces pyxidatus]|uniref:Uncharacterized protein n=1 Tax=Artomyces pyxidatus TaxID=48021 RepID=A0ACB8T0M5_9AGAM|nr:hypothetical protein BV25DRAFT_1825812 [Artomyces pyxidatus]
MVATPVHKASLVDPSTHSPALLELVDVQLSRPVIEYFIDAVVETVDYALGRPSHSKRGRSLSRHSEGSSFATVVNNVLSRAEVEMPVILASLVYLDRAKPHLHIALEEWANERVFLGALIVASKYLNDSSLKNVHWAVCTGVFGKRDIGRIEREFLDVLDFELGISEADIMAHHDAIMPLVSSRHAHGVPHPTALPALDYSSSSTESSPTRSCSNSTDGSFSPRTPVTLVDQAMPAVVKHHHADELHYPAAPLAVPEPHHQKKHSHHGASSTLRMLRNFPFPGRSSSSSSASSSDQSLAQPTAQRCRGASILPPFAAQPTVYA